MSFAPQQNISLASLTTLEVGGPASYFAACDSVGDVTAACAWAQARALPILMMGGGSNLLVADEGFAGLALQFTGSHLSFTAAGPAVRVTAGAGVPWTTLVDTSVAKSLAGVECLAGIPGWVGGAPVQNIGAYGQEIAETVAAVSAVHLPSGQLHTFDASQCDFAYRQSFFKAAGRGLFGVVEVQFLLRPGGPATVKYPELRSYLGEASSAPLAVVRDAVIALRRRKSMIYDRDDSNHRSAGSFFTNPRVSADKLRDLLLQDETMPHFTAGADYKLSAAWLIEHAGFPRGTVDGAVGLSSRHALAIINRGHGTAREVMEFARRLMDAVVTKYGVQLCVEPALVGFDAAAGSTPGRGL